MKNKLIMKFVSIILIFFILFAYMPTVYAGDFDFATSGDCYQDVPGVTPPDDGNDRPPTQPTNPQPPRTPTEEEVTDIVNHVTVQCLTSITGYARDQSGATVPGVTVELMQGNNVVRTTKTDSSGRYTFQPNPGTYTIRFKYGDDVKYNGYDYKVSKLDLDANRITGSNTTTTDTTTNTTTTTTTPSDDRNDRIEENSGTQIFIAIDCSKSTRQTRVNVNGRTTTRFELIVEAAKQLIDSLFIAEDETFYVGLICFSGTNYVSCGLTKDRDKLRAKLREITENGWSITNTDIEGAMNKADAKFENVNLKKYLILLSDGAPTSRRRH